MAGEPDIFTMMFGRDPDASQAAQALARQIRGNQALNLTAALGSPNAIPAMGQVAGQEAAQAQNLLERGAASRLRFGQEQQHHQEIMQQLKNQGMYNAALARAMATMGYKMPQIEQKANTDLRTALDPNGPRSGNLGNYARRAAVLGDLDRLLDQYQNPTSQQWQEIATAFDSAIKMGGAATVHGTKEIVPRGLVGDANKMAAYWSSQPRGAGLTDYHALMKDMVATQKKYWGDQVKSEINKRVGSFSTAYKQFPDSTAETLSSYGIDPTAVKSHPFYSPRSGPGPDAAGGGGSSGRKYPMTLRKGNKQVTVSDDQEFSEASAAGWE